MRRLLNPRCLGTLLLFVCATAVLGAQNLPRSAPCSLSVSPGRIYSLNLTPYVSDAGNVAGLLLEARINGGPLLRLLLDSGAARIALDARASSRSGVAAPAESHLVGIGDSPSVSARTGVASTVDAGPLQYRDCQVDVAPRGLASGIDGVIPISLFAGFLVHLDFPGKALDLTPYPELGLVPSGFEPATLRDGLLFLRGAMNNAPPGNILLDTGACYSAVSRRTARLLTSSLLAPADLRGPNGPVDGGFLEESVRFQVAGRSLTGEPVVALDLAAFNALNDIETDGVLGYPALRYSVLTVDYRDALVRIDGAAGHLR